MSVDLLAAYLDATTAAGLDCETADLWAAELDERLAIQSVVLSVDWMADHLVSTSARLMAVMLAELLDS